MSSTENLHINGADVVAASGGQEDFSWIGGLLGVVSTVGNTATGIIGALNNKQTPVQTTPSAGNGSTANLPAGVNSGTAQAGVPVLLIAGLGVAGVLAAVFLLKSK